MRRKSLLARSVYLLFGVVFVLSIACCTALGQAGTSTVRGTVTDQQGNVVAGATVTLTNLATNTSRTTTSADVGIYTFEFVPPGDYKVEITATGFKKAVVNNVHALVSQSTAVDIKLEVGNVSETVTVAANAAEQLINREDATLGNAFVPKQITELPTNARSIPALLTLQAATTRDGYVAGSRADQSNVTLDGVDINETQTNSVGANVQDDPLQSNLPNNNTVLRLNAEAIQEFRVTTTNPNANQGHSGGAQISLVTRSGSNDWHGSAFELYRSKGLAANDFFNNRTGVPKPQLIRHSFGGGVGGPIVKDRAFFFYSYEGLRQLSQTSVVRTVPLASLGRGELRYRSSSGAIITLTTAQLNAAFPAVGMNPAAIAVFRDAASRYPANDFTTGDSTANALLNTGGFRFNAVTPVTLNSHVGRFDVNVTSKQQLFARVNVIYDLTGQAPQFPDTPAPNVWSHPMGIAAGHTWTISNNLINRFTYGYTREAFSQQGDSAANGISFRFIYSPLAFSRTVTRITPVQTIADDLSWVKENHTFQFGGNVRIVRNHRVGFSNAFDNAIANPSFYSGGAGGSLSTPVSVFATANGIPTFTSADRAAVQNAVSALIGRFSQYTANFTFGADGSLLSSGSPTDRTFATEEYEPYVQDVWKFRSNLTFTLGLRYSLSRPIYETKGFEMKSNIPLSDLFDQRVAGAKAGTPVNTLITFDRSGPKNGRPSLYDWDKNNFQPRIAVAWSPAFKTGLLSSIFGKNSESQFRGGFAITNDQYGSALAVNFDLANAVGFVSNFTTSANTFCTNNAACAAPLFTGFGQNVRPLPKVIVPAKLNFPNLQPADNSRRIETTLDSRLKAPINYSWNFTYERQLPKGLFIQASYIGRYANNLIANRDVMALNNLVDTKSGVDWYTAAGQLERLRAAGTAPGSIAQIPYFANLFPSNLAALINANYCGFTCVPTTVNGQPTTQTQAVYLMTIGALSFGNDWTDTQDGLDTAIGANLFFHPQYGALATYSSIGHSRYNAGTISIRERLGTNLTMDLNYTLSHSLDDASGLQTGSGYGSLFIENPIRQHDWYANSDFDVRHLINANAIWEMPFGRGRHFLTHANRMVDAVVGGWRMTGIFRWNSGFPISTPFDDARWATNWNAQSNAVRIKSFKSCPDRGGPAAPKLFGCDPNGIYQSLRNALPGESGERNTLRLPGYVALDMGIAKKFKLPWGREGGQTLELRLEAFNVTNTQRMGSLTGGRTGYGVGLDPAGEPAGCSGAACVTTPLTAPTIWSNFNGIQGKPREMQFGAIYRF
ncbi:MAG: TonB-dependent receptor [Pyrinomonadaceae bacterium]